MGLKEIRIHCKKCISRVVIVALSAQPPGVNKLCVYIHICMGLREIRIHCKKCINLPPAVAGHQPWRDKT
jgi:hypothetical protein